MTIGIRNRVEAWMFQQALPYWEEHGLDRVLGGYTEALNLDGTNCNASFKRVRVICRQIYVFSHAAVLGWKPGLALAQHGFDYLVNHAWLGDEGGWARSLTRDGVLLDPTADLYDNAFALFALSWYKRASGDPKAQEWAMRTLSFIDKQMRHPSGQGFMHWRPPTGWRQQNPHMHLLEACLASYQAEPTDHAATMALETAGLFERHFFDMKTGTLAEFFDEDWSRAPTPDGQMIEPGHQFEWAWILVNLNQSLGKDLSDHVRALVGFGEAHGINPVNGAVYDGVWTDGSIRDSKSRSWPNTERIKAAVALYELDKKDPRPVFEQSAGLLLDTYLATKPAGCWIDQFDQNGQPLSDKVPASTLYHVFLAFAELRRIEQNFPSNESNI
jgi:mannose/cellobiose epimerase-like protein (N-acyl-D-glucosamine 2-epimerase family)